MLDTFLKIIRTEPVFDAMRACKEDSPFHREESVFVHTMMVCDEYDRIASDLDDEYNVGLFACLLHDTGKPSCRTRKESLKRGVYYNYQFHDIVSAKIAEEMLPRYGFSDFDIFRISWMIRNHQTFWSATHTTKLEYVKMFSRSPVFIDWLTFKNFMVADSRGRIMDVEDFNYQAVLNDFEKSYLG